MAATPSPARNLKWLVTQPSLWIAFALWILLSIVFVALCHGPHGAVPLDLPADQLRVPPITHVIGAWIAAIFFALECGLVFFITRSRAWPDLAARAPERPVALRETISLLVYAVIVLIAGRWVGFHFFGAGISLHLNGSLVGATRVQSPNEVYLWTAWNFILLAVVPYLVFRARGYSHQQLNLKSANWKSDLLVILIVLTIGCAFEYRTFFALNPHQRLVAGTLSFFIHLLLTDLPVMVFIYCILLPRYARLASPATAFLLGAASYPAIHLFESFTRYDSLAHSFISVIFVFLFFFPAGIVKSFLTFRTGNAWVHMWGFHAISPHVTMDSRLIARDFNIS
jgi:hypothetical protein